MLLRFIALTSTARRVRRALLAAIPGVPGRVVRIVEEDRFATAARLCGGLEHGAQRAAAAAPLQLHCYVLPVPCACVQQAAVHAATTNVAASTLVCCSGG